MALLAAVALLLPPPQEGELPEYVVKAGFLFNFAKYVEWPPEAFESPRAPIRIGIAGADPFGPVLERALKDKSVNGRTFTIERYKEPADLKACHILFISGSDPVRSALFLNAAKEPGTLTVGEEKEFARNGGVVSIMIEDGKPKLEVNVEAARERKLTINAKLLKVAALVKGER
jgi:hypothetical protein